MKLYVVLVMELCEFDLDHLVKIKPFKEQDIIIFLYQLGESLSGHIGYVTVSVFVCVQPKG